MGGEECNMEWTPVYRTESSDIIFEELNVDPGPGDIWKNIFFGVTGYAHKDGDTEYVWKIICTRPAPYPAVGTIVTVAKGTAPTMDEAQDATVTAFNIFIEKRNTPCTKSCLDCPLDVNK